MFEELGRMRIMADPEDREADELKRKGEFKKKTGRKTSFSMKTFSFLASVVGATVGVVTFFALFTVAVLGVIAFVS